MAPDIANKMWFGMVAPGCEATLNGLLPVHVKKTVALYHSHALYLGCCERRCQRLSGFAVSEYRYSILLREYPQPTLRRRKTRPVERYRRKRA